MSIKYNKIRTFVLKMVSERFEFSGNLGPSKYWKDFASNFCYVYDLNDAELQRIRYHTYHLTSDIYLTYYFADSEFINLLRTGFFYFVRGANIKAKAEGLNGIGVQIENGKVSHDLLRYLGIIYDLINANLFTRFKPTSILEIGGGYGGLARSSIVHNPYVSYVICDLEETLFFSSVYLTNEIGSDKVHLVENKLDIDKLESGHVYIVPQHRIDFIEDLKFDFAISQQSFQEMTLEQVNFYMEWIDRHAYYFYSCNINDHGAIAKEKKLVTNLDYTLQSYFGQAIWQGNMPKKNQRFGDNHLNRSVYNCKVCIDK
jgi:SAM-dependent methyltransferase